MIKKRLLILISEWLVKGVGKQSCMRFGERLEQLSCVPKFTGARSLWWTHYRLRLVSSLVEYD
jgi:hypothetical protein